jgi:hypothetical protein
MGAHADRASSGAAKTFDASVHMLIQPDFDLDGGADLKATLMAGGLHPCWGAVGFSQSDTMQIVFLAANRHHPLLRERLQRARATVPNARHYIVANLSSRTGTSGPHAELYDTMEEALMATGLSFLTCPEA